MKKMAILAASSALIFAACSGDETTNVTEVTESTGLDVVAKGEKMPACDTANVGQMIFVTDSSAVYYCADGEWTTLKGKDGAAGKDGENTSSETTCGVESIKGGYKILCNGDSIGVIKNGEDCHMEMLDDGTGYGMICGGVLSGKIFKAFCGNTPYDPAVNTCLDSRFLCDAANDGKLEKISNGEEFVCRNTSWVAATEMEKEFGKACVAANKDEQKAYGYSFFICDGTNWTYDFDNIVYGTIEYGGQTYKTVGIGTQMWFAENLNYADSVTVPNLKGGSWCVENDEENCKIYGRVYNWSAAMKLNSKYQATLYSTGVVPMQRQGICPTGWHIPSNEEWKTLKLFVDANNGDEKVGVSLMSTTSDWIEEDEFEKGTNRFGFNALPAGYWRDKNVASYTDWPLDSYKGKMLYMWTSTEINEEQVDPWFIYGLKGSFGSNDTNKWKFYARSVRCLKD